MLIDCLTDQTKTKEPLYLCDLLQIQCGSIQRSLVSHSWGQGVLAGKNFSQGNSMLRPIFNSTVCGSRRYNGFASTE
jgi:hypothetical protein